MQTQIACKAYSNLYCGISFFIKLGEKWQEQRLGIHHYQKGALDKRELPIVQKIPFCNNLQIREIFCPNIGNMPLTEEEFEFVLHEILPTFANLDEGNTYIWPAEQLPGSKTFIPRGCLSEISDFGTLRPFWKNWKISDPLDHLGHFERLLTFLDQNGPKGRPKTWNFRRVLLSGILNNNLKSMTT